MVLKGVWFRKNIVQSSNCFSAPSGSIDVAKRLQEGEIRQSQSQRGVPLICAKWLGELVRQLSALVNVEFGEENEGAMVRVGHRRRRRRRTRTKFNSYVTLSYLIMLAQPH